MTRSARFDDVFAVGAEALAGKTRGRAAVEIAASRSRPPAQM
jgi:hypothetical protein